MTKVRVMPAEGYGAHISSVDEIADRVEVLSGLVGSVAYAEYHIEATEVVALDDDGVTYVPVPDMSLGLANGFTVAGGIMTCTKAGTYMINGTSDLESNKAAKIFYALVIDGTPVPHETTPHTFSNQSKVENISITAIGALTVGQTIEVHVRGDGTAGTILTINKLDVTLHEIPV